jgi:hypothetical protein
MMRIIVAPTFGRNVKKSHRGRQKSTLDEAVKTIISSPEMFDDNDLGRLKACSGRVREARLTLSSQWDLHPQVCAHAGRTRSRSPPLSSYLSLVLTKPSPETFKEPAGSLNVQNNRDLTPITN